MCYALSAMERGERCYLLGDTAVHPGFVDCGAQAIVGSYKLPIFPVEQLDGPNAKLPSDAVHCVRILYRKPVPGFVRKQLGCAIKKGVGSFTFTRRTNQSWKNAKRASRF